MNIVLDANVLFSALIKDSTTRRIILEYDGILLFPAYIFEELEDHEDELLKKSGLSPAEFKKLIGLLLQKVTIVSHDEITTYRSEAYELVKEIDPDDAIFLACIMAYPDSILWSDDKKLKNLKQITVLNTKEIIDLLR